MPRGVYTRTESMTGEEKKARESERRKRYREGRRKQIAEARKQYREKHRESLKAKSRAYYEANREEMKQQAREHYAKTHVPKMPKPKNSGTMSREKYFSDYYRKHRGEILEQRRIYAKAHPEVSRRRNRKRRALKRNATIGNELEMAAWEAGWRAKKTVVCHWCKRRVKPADAHVDHVIPLSKGGDHTVDNLCASCASCNNAKHAKPPDVWNKSLEQPLLFV